MRVDPLPSYLASVSALNENLIAIGYPVAFIEEINTLIVQVGPDDVHSGVPQSDPAPLLVYHSTTSDSSWRISHSVDFIALTCTKYTEWEGFKDRLIEFIELFKKEVGPSSVIRVGLRYKNVIDREKLGLADFEWKELLHPFVLGPLAAQNLCGNGVPEKDVASFFFQSNLLLDDCELLFQGGLARSVDGQKTIFVIDADFYLESEEFIDCMTERNRLDDALNRLHSNAGNIFLKTIQEKLYHALSAHNTK